MKKPHEVLWAAVAENDLLGILVLIAEEHPGNAVKILSKIKTRTAKLEHHPMQGRVVPVQGVVVAPEGRPFGTLAELCCPLCQ